MSNDELMHHGIIGMKWGVRRFQNKDGSLTYAGKKRALSMQEQYTEFSKNKKYRDKDGNLTYAGRKKALKMKEEYSQLTGGKQLRKLQEASKSGHGSINKKISEMSNTEIRDKITRLQLEGQLKSISASEKTTGQKFVDSLKDSASSIIKTKGTQIVGDLIDKKMREMLGLSNNNSLKKQAEDAENRFKIASNNRKLSKLNAEISGEKKAAAQKAVDDYIKKTSANSATSGTYRKSGEGIFDSKISTGKSSHNRLQLEDHSKQSTSWHGTVEGAGTSRYNPPSGPIIDATNIRELNPRQIEIGQNYVAGLLEDKKRKW
jgi:hypothetical protein